MAWFDLNDEGYFIEECPRGHRSIVVLDLPKYAVLFDSALLAWCDGYHRESVASFAGALEDFYL